MHCEARLILELPLCVVERVSGGGWLKFGS